MNDLLLQFFRHASSLCLRDDERASIRAELQHMMRQDQTQTVSAQDEETGNMLAAIRDQESGLAPVEKDHMRQQILLHMRSNPLPVKRQESVSSVFGSWLHLFAFGVMPRTAMLAAIVLLVGGGVAYAAGSSIPGDALYPVKVGVVEPISERLRARDPSAVAAWEVRLAERRLAEADALANTGDLTPDQWIELERRFDGHVSRSLEELTRAEQEQESLTMRAVQSRLHDSIRKRDALRDSLRVIADVPQPDAAAVMLYQEEQAGVDAAAVSDDASVSAKRPAVIATDEQEHAIAAEKQVPTVVEVGEEIVEESVSTLRAVSVPDPLLLPVQSSTSSRPSTASAAIVPVPFERVLPADSPQQADESSSSMSKEVLPASSTSSLRSTSSLASQQISSQASSADLLPLPDIPDIPLVPGL